MWCGGLKAPWELVQAVFFHPSITNQVGTALNSQSVCSQYLALLKLPTKQIIGSLSLQNWSKFGDETKSLQSRLQLLMGVSMPRAVRLLAWVRADHRSRCCWPGRNMLVRTHQCSTGTPFLQKCLAELLWQTKSQGACKLNCLPSKGREVTWVTKVTPWIHCKIRNIY